MRRFIMSLGDESFKFTCYEAKSRGISVQQLIRAVIIPEWMEKSRSIDVKPLLSSRELSFSLGRLSPSAIGERTRK
jgi:hypothetical protein